MLERPGLSGEMRERGPVAVSKIETSDEGTGNGTAIFNGWANKWTPDAMKLGRRSVYTIIRPHDKLHHIPRTFLRHLYNNISEVPRARASVSGLGMDNGENRGNPNGCKF